MSILFIHSTTTQQTTTSSILPYLLILPFLTLPYSKMKFTSIFLIALLVLSCAISAFATPQCEDCKNALKTADGKLPAKRTRQLVENFLQQNCQTATGLVPIEVPVPLPVKLVCFLII